MASLADFCVPGADPSLEEPLASRLLKLLEFFKGRVRILSGRRSTAQQQKLYDDWVASGYKVPPTVAVPGTSNHEKGLAADLQKDADLTWGEVHYTAAAYGLIFRLPSEDWHVEAQANWTEPEEPDMTPDQLAQAFGGALDAQGRIVVPLADGNLYPLANVLGFIHQEITTDTSLPARIKRVLAT